MRPLRGSSRALLLPLAAAALALAPASRDRASADPGEAWREVRSNDGAFLVRYRTSPAEIELGIDFDLEVELAAPPGAQLPTTFELRIDGDMPEHGHGLLRQPRTERLGPARFRARDLRFFMPGHWELYFDLSHGALTERAQAEVVLD